MGTHLPFWESLCGQEECPQFERDTPPNLGKVSYNLGTFLYWLSRKDFLTIEVCPYTSIGIPPILSKAAFTNELP